MDTGDDDNVVHDGDYDSGHNTVNKKYNNSYCRLYFFSFLA